MATWHRQLQILRINKLRRKIAAIESNIDTQQQIKTLVAAKRKPGWRVRSSDGLGYRSIPRTTYRVNSTHYLGPVSNAKIGTDQSFSDMHPIARLNPPRNIAYGQKVTVYSLKAGFEIHEPKLDIVAQESQWPFVGTKAYPVSEDISTPLTFDYGLANGAMLKAYSKMNEADLQLNEYVFEWKQVVRLLKDPFKTVLRAHRILDRWARRDNWIYVPSHIVRKHVDGVLVSKRPTGAVLMSFRTRRTIPVSEASNAVLNAAANRWLQYRYGIAPMIKDITKVMVMVEKPPFTQQLRSASGRLWVSRQEESTSDFKYRWIPVDLMFKVTRQTGSFYAAKVWYKVAYEPPTSWTLGLHPRQWINALYNAVPYSFVLDWAINLDEWMKAINVPPWIKPVANVCTAKEYDYVRSVCTSVRWISSPYYQGSITKTPLAFKRRLRFHRKIDLPPPTKPVVGTAWRSMKNVMTGLALLYKPLIRK